MSLQNTFLLQNDVQSLCNSLPTLNIVITRSCHRKLSWDAQESAFYEPEDDTQHSVSQCSHPGWESPELVIAQSYDDKQAAPCKGGPQKNLLRMVYKNELWTITWIWNQVSVIDLHNRKMESGPITNLYLNLIPNK